MASGYGGHATPSVGKNITIVYVCVQGNCLQTNACCYKTSFFFALVHHWTLDEVEKVI